MSPKDIQDTLLPVRLESPAPAGPKPQFLARLGSGHVSKIFLYSMEDFHRGANVAEQARGFDGQDVLPYFGEHNLIDLGKAFDVQHVRLALAALRANEDPAITELRRYIVELAEELQMFDDAPRTITDAEARGFLVDGYAVGVLAYEI